MADLPPEDAFEPSGALIGFVSAAVLYAAGRADADETRLLDSPFSGVERDVARMLVTAAKDRERPSDVFSARRLVLAHETTLALHRFVAALNAIERAFRTQGASAASVVGAIDVAFALARDATPSEAATLGRLNALAGEFDAERADDAVWDAPALVDRIDDDPSLLLRAGAVREPVAALGPHANEPGWPVPRRRGHQSASSLGAFAECNRKWYYRYACAAVEDRGSAASAYGSAFHWALEQFHTEFPRADAAPEDLLARKLSAYLNEAFERYRFGFPTNVEYELQRRRARRTAERYLAWFLERSRAHPFTVIGQEAVADVEFDGYQFLGYIDRLDRDDATGGVTVVDYKTGNIAESAAEYRRRVADFVDFQLPFYYWARTEAGDHVTRLALVPLKEANLDVRPIELEVVQVPAAASDDRAALGTIGIDELLRARRRMVELARVLADEDVAHFPATDDPDACTYCAYLNSCRARPMRREDRFGR
jgi:RecB family exonuclease